MIEYIELRVVEDFASRLLRPDEGTRLGSGMIRKVRFRGDDARLSEVGDLRRRIKDETGRALFHGWAILRKYTKAEIEAATLFLLKIGATFEPAGEECGTKYDESAACDKCGAGARRVGPLVLDTRRIPRRSDIGRTIAGELVVSARARAAFEAAGLDGVDFEPVLQKQTGRAMSDWFALDIKNCPADIVPPTRTGIDPFDLDEAGQYRCAKCDLIGLNLLSEAYVKLQGSQDFACTRQFIGVRRGLLRPERLILVSPAVRQVCQSKKLMGFDTEIAHLVG